MTLQLRDYQQAAIDELSALEQPAAPASIDVSSAKKVEHSHSECVAWLEQQYFGDPAHAQWWKEAQPQLSEEAQYLDALCREGKGGG